MKKSVTILIKVSSDREKILDKIYPLNARKISGRSIKKELIINGFFPDHFSCPFFYRSQAHRVLHKKYFIFHNVLLPAIFFIVIYHLVMESQFKFNRHVSS
jgi:hypothetical protein